MPLPSSLKLKSRSELKRDKREAAGERASKPAKTSSKGKGAGSSLKQAAKYTAKFYGADKLAVPIKGSGGYGNRHARKQDPR